MNILPLSGVKKWTKIEWVWIRVCGNVLINFPIFLMRIIVGHNRLKKQFPAVLTMSMKFSNLNLAQWVLLGKLLLE